MRLLVSVVSEEEVAAAVEGGADIVDVKNPREGALGGNFPHVIRRVRELTPTALEVSATIGDVPNLPGTVSPGCIRRVYLRNSVCQSWIVRYSKTA